MVQWCLAVDCNTNPPVGADQWPDDNKYVSNVLANNGTAPIPFGGLEFFAADITYLVDAGHLNCFAKNTYDTLLGTPGYVLAQSCN